MKPLSNNELTRAMQAPVEGTIVVASDRKARHNISTRAQNVWDRLLDWYGVSKMADFGAWPGPDLCSLIDSIRTRDDMGTFMANVRGQHPQWPPTFGQMEAIVAALAVPAGVDMGTRWNALTAHVLRNRNLTVLQIAGKPPWTWSNDGVRIPADGKTPGFFVSITEVQ